MAKHLGTRRRPLLRRPLRDLVGHRRGVVWVVGALAVSTATAVVVTQGLGNGDGDAGQQVANAASVRDGALRAGAPRVEAVRGRQDRQAAHRRHRGVDVSRQALRPRFARYRVLRGQTLSLKPAVVLAHEVAARSPAHSTFTIAQSNILGSQHTTGRGGYGPGTYRAGLTASFLTSRGVDVGGMEEVQANQLAVLRSRMPAYSFWPASSLGHNGERLQIYWRSDRFTMEQSGSVTYVFSSQRIPLPYVLLRDSQSGAEFWMIATHNSAGGMQGQRDLSTGIEIALINRLRATGLPVLIVGDMNEHTSFFCRVASATGMVAANGGSGVGGCHLPPPPLRVDWIMGGGGIGSAPSAVSFSGYRQDGTLLHRASDHYYLFAQVTTTSSWFAPGSTP
jgi:hypothetical protein